MLWVLIKFKHLNERFLMSIYTTNVFKKKLKIINIFWLKRHFIGSYEAVCTALHCTLWGYLCHIMEKTLLNTKDKSCIQTNFFFLFELYTMGKCAFRTYAHREDPDQPRHLSSLIRQSLFCLLTLVLLNPDIHCLCKQCRSRSVGF